MFVPFIFTLDIVNSSENYFFWAWFYFYASACIKNKWPIIAHERYFKRFSHVEEMVFGSSLRDFMSVYHVDDNLTTENMLTLKTYPVSQLDEDTLIAKYPSPPDCWIDLLKNENPEFEQIIGTLLDSITEDFGEKPEGVLVFELLPKALFSAANKRGIPVFFQAGGIVRQPFASTPNAFSLINDDNAEAVKLRYDRFISAGLDVPMLSRKGLLRLFASEAYMMDIHNIDAEPEYDVGVLYSSAPSVACYHVGQEYISDQEMSARAKEHYDKVLIRTRPGFEPAAEALDDSPSCFHFCCKCKRVIGFMTKGMFEAMLAGRIAHEYGSLLFTCFCNNGIEDNSKGIAPIEFLNFILFGLCIPFEWLTTPDYLHFLLANPTGKELYMRSFEYFTRRISRDDLEFYYMTDNRAYRLGDPLYFSSGHKPHEYAAYYCTGGLYINQVEYTWSNGEYTSFEFDLTEAATAPLTISVALYEFAMDYDSPNTSQTVTCEANGINCGSVTLIPGKKYFVFTIPAGCFTDKLRIKFRYGYLHQSGDAKIAIAFERMYVSLSSQRLIEDAMSVEIAGLEYKASVLRAQNSELEARTSGLEMRNLGLEAHVSELEEQINLIYNSRSWKLGNGIMKVAAKIVRRKKTLSLRIFPKAWGFAQNQEMKRKRQTLTMKPHDFITDETESQ